MDARKVVAEYVVAAGNLELSVIRHEDGELDVCGAAGRTLPRAAERTVAVAGNNAYWEHCALPHSLKIVCHRRGGLGSEDVEGLALARFAARLLRVVAFGTADDLCSILADYPERTALRHKLLSRVAGSLVPQARLFARSDTWTPAQEAAIDDWLRRLAPTSKQGIEALAQKVMYEHFERGEALMLPVSGGGYYPFLQEFAEPLRRLLCGARPAWLSEVPGASKTVQLEWVLDQVQIRVYPEPENPHDPQAMAVHAVLPWGEYMRVGYLGRSAARMVQQVCGRAAILRGHLHSLKTNAGGQGATAWLCLWDEAGWASRKNEEVRRIIA